MTDLFRLDGNILLFLQEYVRNPVLDVFFKTITHLGDSGAIWLVLGVFLLLLEKNRKVVNLLSPVTTARYCAVLPFAVGL